MWWAVVSLVLSWSCQTSAVDVSTQTSVNPVHVSCKDENNKAVDWYILYKAPSDPKTSPKPQTTPKPQKSGLEYIYFDPTTEGKRGLKNINHPDGVLANTLRPMLGSVRNMPKSFGFLSYSDQPPGSNANMTFGHSKGVVLGDSGTQTALWLTHSTPQFPFRRDQNKFWPPSGNANAQTFMCVSLNFPELKTVGEHLQKIRAFTFDYDLPTDFLGELTNAANWDKSDSSLGEFQILTTKDKKQLKIMAKDFIKQFNKKAGVKRPREDLTPEERRNGDLYLQLAHKLNSDVDAKVWGCQRDKDKSYCEGQHKVMNVENIKTELGVWSWTTDHSKWAVTKKENPWTCICDMNRSVSQYERRGGALCIQNTKINELFRGFAGKTEACSQEQKPPGNSDSGPDCDLDCESDSDCVSDGDKKRKTE